MSFKKRKNVSLRIKSRFWSKRAVLIKKSVRRGTQVKATYRCVIPQDKNIRAPGHRYSRPPPRLCLASESFGKQFAFPSLIRCFFSVEAQRGRRRCRCCCCYCRTQSPRWLLPLRHRGAAERGGGVLEEEGEVGVLYKKRLSLRCKSGRQVFSLKKTLVLRR